jgi:hypothetical protein
MVVIVRGSGRVDEKVGLCIEIQAAIVDAGDGSEISR